MPSIFNRSLIFVGLLIAGLVIYAGWYGLKADRFDEVAVPYLESALPELASWQYARLQPFLSPEARIQFDSEEGQKVYRLFSKLGNLEAQGRPKFLGDRTDTSMSLGDIQILAYQVPLKFETGPAIIKLNLANDGKRYYIHHFGIHSEIFLDTAPSQ